MNASMDSFPSTLGHGPWLASYPQFLGGSWSSFRGRLGWIVLALLLWAAPRTRADVQLLSLNAVWRYQQTASLDAQNWQASAYDDSGWPSGNALLYVENNPLVSPRNTMLTIGRTTYYFRTHLTLPSDPSNVNVTLTFSASIDDGAVFYLNGQEIQRVRMPASPAVISYTNLATATPSGGDAIIPDVFVLPNSSLSSLVRGDNVLAVEVHQNATNSDDIVFGASVTLKFTSSPPVIFQQPVDLSVLDGRSAMLSAVIDGDPAPLLQWYQNGSPVPGATHAYLFIPAATFTNAGSYWLSATNSLGGLITSNALLTVLADTNPPSIISSMAQKNLTNIVVAFSEPVLSSTATAASNYEIFQPTLPANRLDVLTAVLTGASNVILTTAARVPGINYTLRVNGVRDISSASNAIAANTEVPLSYRVDLVRVDAQTLWKYNQSGQLPATNWTAADFDDSGWVSGAAVFQAGVPLPNTTDPVRSTLAFATGTNVFQTYYFRVPFDLPGPVDVGSFQMHDIVDDGAVFYLNGSEVFSIGMPATRPVTYSAAASRLVGAPAYEPSLAAPGWLVAGTNVAPTGNAFAAEVHQYASGLSDVDFAANLDAVISRFYPCPRLAVPSVVQEGAGALANRGQVFILEPLSNDLPVQLISSRPGDVGIPASVNIPAGATNAAFDLIIGDDSLLNGPRSVTLRVSGTEVFSTTTTLQMLDNETNILTVVIAPTTTETNGSLPGEVHFSQPAAAPIVVALASSDPASLRVPPSVLIPAGATSAVFQATVVDDALLNGPRSVVLTASVPGWPAGSATVIVNDNESATLAMQLLTSVVEGGGTVTNAGNVTLGGITVSNLVITLSSSQTTLISVPASITVAAGQSNAFFDVTVIDNSNYDPPRTVTITASAQGFTPGGNSLIVFDDDPDHFEFTAVSSPQTAATPFALAVTALGPDGTTVTNYKGSPSLAATALEGNLSPAPATVGPFVNGRWSGTLAVMSAGRLVRLSSPLAPGQSNPFHVLPQAFRALTQANSDIAVDPVSGTLFASVPAAGGIYSNKLVAIDATAGTVTNSYPLGADPGQIEIAPNGQFLYAAVSNHLAVQRFDLSTRKAGSSIAMGSSQGYAYWIRDLAVLSGVSDSAVVTLGDTAGNSRGVWRYNSGIPVQLGDFSTLDPYWIEASPVNQTLYGYQNNNQFPLMRGLASPGSPVTAVNGLFSGGSLTYRYGVLYGNLGRAVQADTFALLGDYPNVIESVGAAGLVEVDPALKRTFYLAGYVNYGSAFYKLKAYDRDSFVSLAQLSIPAGLMQGGPGRLLRWSSNGLVFNTSSQIIFVQSDLMQPTWPAANLSLTQSVAPLPAVLSSNLNLTLTISNAGPGVATFLRASNALPANTAILGWSASAGAVTQSSGSILWNLDELDAGSNATLQLSVRFSTAGWQTNTASIVAFEPDPDFSDNLSRLGLYVQLPPDAQGAFSVQCASEDLIYDPVRDRLLLSVGSGIGGQNNGIAVFDPYHGVLETFASLAKRPTRLARSDDGQFLYVSLPDDALVRRLTLTNLSQNLQFSLGGESIYGTWYPWYAADMAVMPGSPGTIAAFRVRRAGPMANEYGQGIAVVDNGVMRSNATPSGGSWQVEFDTDSGTLLGFDSVNLLRCSIDASGVSIAEQYPPLSSAGTDIKYAAGRLFTSAGRLVQYQPFQLEWIFAGAESAVLVEPDAASGRVFYLVQNNGWQINAYDVQSRLLLGTIPVANVTGTPSSLIRWGTNGLAFRTSNNQVFIIRTPLAQPSAAADIAVGIEGPNTPVAVGQEALLILTLTNRGPLSASYVVLTNVFSPSVSIDWSFCTDGAIATTNGQVVWNLVKLDPAQDSFAAVVVRSAQAGVVSIAANAGASTLDLRPGDNSAFATLQVGGVPPMDSVLTLALPVQDLVWSPSLGRLLATSTANAANWSGSLLSIDPAALTVQFETTLGSDAGCLALSRDDSILYVGVDHGVNALAIPGLANTNHFTIAGDYTYDLEVVPGADQSLVVASRNRSDNSTWLGVYDSGVQRTNTQFFYTTGLSLEFGDNPATLYSQDYSYFRGFCRYAISGQGITLLDNATVLPYGTSIDIKSAEGLLYTSLGIVVDPVTREQVRTIPGITNNSPLCYDEATKRVFYLMPAGSSAVLLAVDAVTMVPLGSRSVSGFSGAPADLVRWGADGLAFHTSSGLVAVLQSSLVPSDPSTDLRLTLVASNTLAFVGSNFVYSVMVTNAGSNFATNTQIALALPMNVSIIGVATSRGAAVTSPGQVLANLGTLLPGDAAKAFVTIAPTQPGNLIAVARVTSSALDPDPTNNARSITNAAVLLVARDAMVVVSQAAADLVFNPATGRLYASGNANSVSVINPALAQVEGNWPIPTQPGRLALSDSGLDLFVSHDSGRQLARLRTPDGVVVTNSSLGTIGSDPFTLVDIEVIPGTSNSVVINEEAGGTRYVAVMDDGATRPARPQVSYGSFLEFGGDPSVVYLSGLQPLAISANGAMVLPGSGVFSSTSNFKYDSGLFYTDAGGQVDAADRIVATRFPGLGAGTLVETDTGRRRIYFLTCIANVWQLRAYDPVTTDLVGSLALTNEMGTPSALVRWGEDGLAFCTTSSQIFLLRPSFVPSGPAADLQVTQTPVPAGPVCLGSNVTFVVQVTNVGPSSASAAQLLSRIPTNTTIVQALLSQGTTSFSGGLLTCSLGTLTNGGAAQLTLTLRPLRAGALAHRVTATSANTDPDLSNNTVTTSVGVQLNLSPDAAGVVDLQTADIEYDPVSGLIYASLTDYLGAPYENSVVSIDPATGLLGVPIPVGPELSHIAITDDGSALYALAGNGSQFRRMTLPSGNLELSVPFSTATGQSESAADDIRVVPSQREALAVILRYPGLLAGGSPALVAYDDATPRPMSLIWQNTMEFFSTNLLIGLYWNSVPEEATRIELTTTGFVACASAWDLLDGSTFVDDAGLIYTSGGGVFDPMTLSKIGSYGVSGLVAADHRVNRVCFLAAGGSTSQVRFFDQQTQVELGSLTVTNVIGAPTKLIRCGVDRLAFRTSGGQVFILRSSFIPTADVLVMACAATNQVMAGDTVSLQLIVSNAGPYAVSGVSLTNTVPAGFNIVSTTLTQGTFSTNAQTVIAAIGDLATNAGATLTLVLSPTGVCLGLATNFADVGASSPADPILSNNHVALSLRVLPRDSDHDGMPDDWEVAHGLNPFDPADAALDSDGDGTSNLQEYLAGTDPFAFDGLRIVSARFGQSGQFEFTVHAAIGKTYAVEWSTNLAQWSLIITFVCREDNQPVQVPVWSVPACFYRLKTTTNAPVPVLSLINRPQPPANPPQLQVAAPPGYRYALQVSTNFYDWIEVTNYYCTCCRTLIVDPSSEVSTKRFYRVLDK